VAYNLKKFNKVSSTLEPGESFLAGAPALPPGGVGRSMVGGALGGAVGVIAAGSGSATAGAFELPGRFTLALTDRRIMVFKPDPWLGRPKKLVGSIPLADVAGAAFTESGAVSKRAAVSLRNGTSLDVEVQKGIGRAWMEHFIEQVNARIAA